MGKRGYSNRVAPYRQFDRKSYRFFSSKHDKTSAERVAKGIRKEGDRARVVKLSKPLGPFKRGYAVYMRLGRRGTR